MPVLHLVMMLLVDRTSDSRNEIISDRDFPSSAKQSSLC